MGCRLSRRSFDLLQDQDRAPATSPKCPGSAPQERSLREIEQVLLHAEFLGHTITKNGIKTSAGLSKAIQDWPTPKSTKDVQQFLGLAQFYQQYVSGFARIALPLSSLLANNTPFTWTDTQQSAFLHLKQAICSAPVLRIFDPDLITFVDTDASGFAIGAVLLQKDQQGNAHPIAFTSRKLQSAERNYPTHEQELLAVIHALRTWRYYLDGTKFTVNTDHDTLRHFPTQPKLTRRQARWMVAAGIRL